MEANFKFPSMSAGKVINRLVWLYFVVIFLLPQAIYASEYSARGLIKAKSRAVLASEIGAVVSETPLRSGDSFKSGDLLIGFDCRLLKNQMEKIGDRFTCW